jgi:hypothetical protein
MLLLILGILAALKMFAAILSQPCHKFHALSVPSILVIGRCPKRRGRSRPPSHSSPGQTAVNYANNPTLPQFIIGFALGSEESGTLPNVADLPATMEVDWIRYSALGPAQYSSSRDRGNR